MKKVIISGVTGQDGSYLAEYLLDEGYEVYGLVRRHAVDDSYENITNILDNRRFELVHCDLTSGTNVNEVLTRIQPHIFYNLAAQSDVGISFNMPEHTFQTNANGVLNILETIRMMSNHIDFGKTKLYQASTSEMFGKVAETPQTEKTPFYPRSPYGVSKLAAYWLTVNYREAYDIFACNGILFNHESPRRGKNFVTRKITSTLKQIKEGNVDCLYLGNVDAMRDWGHAKDYVKAMHLMMLQDEPSDYVIATGKHRSVRQFVELAGQFFKFDIKWEGEGSREVGIDRHTGKVIVRIDPWLYRPTEVQTLLGDSTKAHTVLKWTPEYDFEDLVWDMCINEK